MPLQKIASKTSTSKVGKTIEQKPVEVIDLNLIFELKGESYAVKGLKQLYYFS